MKKKLLITIAIILIIIITVVCVLYFKQKSNLVENDANLINMNTMANIESNSFLETSNELDNTLVETNSIESESNKENSNNVDTETKNSNNAQKNSTINKSNNNTKEDSKDKTNNKNNSNTNKVENNDTQSSNNSKKNDKPKEQSQKEEQQEEQKEINTELANTHFTKYNAEKTAHAVNYLNNLIKSQSDYDEFGGYAIAVTSKPTSDWFSYSDYKLNGLALSGYIVKVYIEDEYRYNSRGTSYSLYDTKAYVYQEFMD